MRVAKRLAVLLIILIAHLTVCEAQRPGTPARQKGAEQAKPDNWKEFASTEGRFSVLLPGTPTLIEEPIDTLAGKIANFAYVLETKGGTYVIMYSDLPSYLPGPEFAKRGFDAGRDRMLAKDKTMRMVSEKDISLAEHLGREWLAHDEEEVTRGRDLLVNGRMYLTLFVMPKFRALKTGRADPVPENHTDLFKTISSRFLDSFKLLPNEVEQLGEVDRLLRDLKKQNQTVLVIGSADSPSKSPITSDVINGRAIRLVQPTYPVIAHAAHASGQVSVLVLIDLDGHVAAVQAEAGHPLLRPAAIKAARESSFTPTKLNGKPVRVMGLIIYNFVAQ